MDGDEIYPWDDPPDFEAEFWNERNRWPRDAFGFVFLGNAVDQVGAVLFGNEWSLKDADKRGEVAKKLHGWFLDEDLKTALRDVGGGELEPQTAGFWHKESWRQDFSQCSYEAGDLAFCYIFVDADKLGRLIRQLTGEPGKTGAETNSKLSDVYLSPYMQLAIDAIQHHEITETHHDTKAAIKAWLMEAGEKRGLSLSDRDADSIATMIRHPNAKMGKAKGT